MPALSYSGTLVHCPSPRPDGLFAARSPLPYVQVLDPESSGRRDLLVSGSNLIVGTVYMLRVTGCMTNDLSVCGTYTTAIALTDEPLTGSIAGGDRTIGGFDAVVLDACASVDPDDPLAVCDVSTSPPVCSSNIRFEWSCAPFTTSNMTADVALTRAASGLSSCGVGVVPAQQTECRWTIPPDTLQAATSYAFRVRVYKPSTNSGNEAIYSTVNITIQSGFLPGVDIQALAKPKQVRAWLRPCVKTHAPVPPLNALTRTPHARIVDLLLPWMCALAHV
jgi:hypothetical protein